MSPEPKPVDEALALRAIAAGAPEADDNTMIVTPGVSFRSIATGLVYDRVTRLPLLSDYTWLGWVQDEADLLSELDRLTSELAAAQAEVKRSQVVFQWRLVDGLPAIANVPRGPDMQMCFQGLFELWVVTEFPPNYPYTQAGWWLKVNGDDARDPRNWNGERGLCGPETGAAGQRAAEEAYFRAVGQVRT